MSERERILIGIGFDETPEEIMNVVKNALLTGKITNPELYLIHVIRAKSRMSFYYDAYNLWQKIKSRAIIDTAQQMKRYVNALGDDFGKIEIIIEAGDPSKKISEVAEILEADLIIVGHHRRNFVNQLLHGNTGVSILDNSSRPVLSFCIGRNFVTA